MYYQTKNIRSQFLINLQKKSDHMSRLVDADCLKCDIHNELYELRALNWHIVTIWKMRNLRILLVDPPKSDQGNRRVLQSRVLIVW